MFKIHETFVLLSKQHTVLDSLRKSFYLLNKHSIFTLRSSLCESSPATALRYACAADADHCLAQPPRDCKSNGDRNR